MKTTINLRDFLFSLFLALACLAAYDHYFKIHHWPASQDSSNKDLWADWRGSVDDLTTDDVVILGSSHGHFDINIHLWDSITGRRPVMLAYPGTSPYHTFEDIVENSNFRGLLLVSIAPGLFYTMKGSWGANGGKELVDYYNTRTYAQKFSAAIYELIDPHLHFTDPDISLKSLISVIPIPNRDSVEPEVYWPPMVRMDKYRNIRMIPEMETDTSLQNWQKDIWFNPDPKNRYADSIDAVLGHYVNLAKEFTAKGGRVAFIRPPVTGHYLERESRLYPREQYFDRLLKDSECPGYHFQDYEETRYMIPPEWSHLNRKDSDTFTRVIIRLLQNDKLL